MRKLIFFTTFIILFSCKNKNKPINIIDNNINYKKAKVFRDAKISDSAFYYFNIAKNEYLKNNDSLGVAKSLVNMAMIQTRKEDFFGGIESSLEANRYLKKDNDSTVRSTLAINYNNIAIDFNYLKNYKNAFEYFNQALKFTDNHDAKYLFYNNIGDVLINEGELELAKNYLRKAILSTDQSYYAMALNNLTKAEYLSNPSYDPVPNLLKALTIRQNENDSLGQSSSYSTIADYYYDKNKALSLKYAKMMLQKCIQNKSANDQLEALQKIIKLDPKNYLKNFSQFKELDDSLQLERNRAKNQFAFIRYDLEGKNAENEILKTAKVEDENKLLQLSIITSAIVFALIITNVWYRKRQIRLKQEKELEVKNTQLRLSKKVHDVVANGIYQVMTKIENQEHFDRDTALDELEFVYEKSRDISYDKADEEQEFSKKISELIASFNNDTVKTFTAGNNPALWETISPLVKDEVFQIIRELMVNMKKHSQASHVAFRFERTETSVEIQYKDNGIGIPGDLIYKNGLRNAESRMAAIGGAIIFDTEIEKGLKVNLSVPAS
ncbi:MULTISPECIES: ATP-binding protein [Chryseobacterium]|uniref:histidine kinase n=1 Tax=Chryseobacterium camelliae TaxID=1265445 RepID=A0ABU0TMM9_9FLAO|nr:MULTISPECIES: tetratricopeptide repeat-containing sensor histidine kinase [Chryseobacterium]MDT3407841.1 tetratricopeptide (TPR) repeat protein [Pseudacidovorax intermedius]MDQ1098304.1 tetratricopeptide (TPR) repeat protein [Chryseobacterium camelliae]MDQ1102230.1 tetratricopeptide (TPR) repeat protein [Chryseobacterium sp. SORGH_AS_1048]MDR6085668.1 tetratricopeptide (TPR) repeat protein [Chryseobacterium sp. SORGH_AS_0909]MDR6130035.1 tetratricopeptide (TPR) repeat protein [Chryseobacter